MKNKHNSLFSLYGSGLFVFSPILLLICSLDYLLSVENQSAHEQEKTDSHYELGPQPQPVLACLVLKDYLLTPVRYSEFHKAPGDDGTFIFVVALTKHTVYF